MRLDRKRDLGIAFVLPPAHPLSLPSYKSGDVREPMTLDDFSSRLDDTKMPAIQNQVRQMCEREARAAKLTAIQCS